MGLPLYQVDAFADAPFTGNPAAVCLLEKPVPTEWMQSLAREMNLSETAFVRPREGGFALRWFTPKVEVELCGHATLASAHVLWESGRLAPEETARFHTQSGWLTCTRQGEWIEMDFPSRPAEAIDPPAELFTALGVMPLYVGANHEDYLLELHSEADVRGVEPDFDLLARVSVRGVMVTARSEDEDVDFVSRFFAPAAGVDEDPVTGSAHCCLAPFWARRLGKDALIGYQASARGGTVRVRVDGERVHLGGRAVTILVGELHEAP